MGPQGVENWPAVKRRWEAWWQVEMYDRPLLCVRAPRAGAVAAPGLPPDPARQWTDSATIIRRTEEVQRSTYYGGEALPLCWNPISAGHALYFGCTPHFQTDTVWVEPAPPGPDGLPVLSGWRTSPWWHLACTMTEAFARASHGRFFVPSFWGNHEGDTLALVRGLEQFYVDCALGPDGAHAPWLVQAIREMAAIMVEIHTELDRRTAPDQVGLEGHYNSLGCWSPRPTLAYDCDVSYNLSPRTFRELFVPPMVEAMHAVEHRVYHLDGARALHHLDTLLGIAELQAIQWVPGAGQEALAQWLPLLRRIQASGKSLLIYIQPEELDLLLDAFRERTLRPQGLCINVNCPSERAARQTLEQVRWL